MIQVSVDESYAYDMLSIAYVKYRNINSEASKAAFINLNDEIESKVGIDKHTEVVLSYEYNALININACIYNAIENINKNKAPAITIHKMNLDRYRLKKDIQNKYFSVSMSEIKSQNFKLESQP